MKIYHNPGCSKSRAALDFLQKAQKDFEIILYLENPPSEAEIRDLLKKLKLKPLGLVRKTEALWQENYEDKNLSEDEIIRLLAENPQLIERPVVVKGRKAVIGRPLEKVEKFLLN